MQGWESGSGDAVIVNYGVDRTRDFMSLLAEAKLGAPPATKHNNKGSTTATSAIVVESTPAPFMVACNSFAGKGRLVNQKLILLRSLVKSSTSLFNENTAAPQIEACTAQISAEIQNLTTLLRLMSEEGEKARSLAHTRMKSRHTSGPASGICTYSICGFIENVVAYSQLQMQAITSDFRDILRTRAEVLQQQQERKNKLEARAPSTEVSEWGDNNLSAKQILRHRSLLQTEGPHRLLHRSPAESDAGQVSICVDSSDSDESPPAGHVSQTTSRTDYYASRVTAMNTIEGYLRDVNRTVQTIAHLVVEQGEMVRRIDDNIEEASHHVDQTHDIIEKEYEEVRKERYFIIKLLIAVLIVAVLILLFLL
ncbi:syntaxin 5 [Pelomyxa schiedti]|nr:syntaxin 5 [Pelomyxa schiedti]